MAATFLTGGAFVPPWAGHKSAWPRSWESPRGTFTPSNTSPATITTTAGSGKGLPPCSRSWPRTQQHSAGSLPLGLLSLSRTC